MERKVRHTFQILVLSLVLLSLPIVYLLCIIIEPPSNNPWKDMFYTLENKGDFLCYKEIYNYASVDTDISTDDIEVYYENLIELNIPTEFLFDSE